MKKSIIYGLVLALPLTMMGQTKDSVAYNESVVVTGEYNPVLDNTLLKLNVAPQFTDTAMGLQHTFTYGITPRRLTSIFQPTRIKAAKIIGEPATRLYNNYFRLGLGNYYTGMLDAFYNSTRHERLKYGAGLQHLGSWGTIGHKPQNGVIGNPYYYGAAHYATTQLFGFADYILRDNAELGTSLRYQNDYNLYYGFSDSTLLAYGKNYLGNNAYRRYDISRGDYSGMWNLLEWTGGIKSLNTDVNQFGYDANVLLGHLWGRPEMSEFHMSLDATAHYGFPLFKKYKGIAALQVAWDHYGERYGLDNYNPDNKLLPLGYYMGPYPAIYQLYFGNLADSNRWNKDILALHPYIDFLLKDFKFHVGARGVWDAFSTSQAYDQVESLVLVGTAVPDVHLTDNLFHFFPDIVVNKNFMGDAMNLSAGFTGDIEANSWNNIRLSNPYVSPNQVTRATRHYDVFARMRFDFSKKLGMNLHAEYAWLRNALCFSLDENYKLNNMYKASYMDFTMLRMGGDFSFVNDEMLQANIGGNYYSYSNIKGSDQSFRAYRPTFDAHLNISVNYNNKIKATLEGLMLSKMTAEYRTTATGAVLADTLPQRYGLSLNVEYIHNRALSFFLNLDNIAAQRFFYWANYPSRRLTAMVGLTYTIPTKKH